MAIGKIHLRGSQDFRIQKHQVGRLDFQVERQQTDHLEGRNRIAVRRLYAGQITDTDIGHFRQLLLCSSKFFPVTGEILSKDKQMFLIKSREVFVHIPSVLLWF